VTPSYPFDLILQLVQINRHASFNHSRDMEPGGDLKIPKVGHVIPFLPPLT